MKARLAIGFGLGVALILVSLVLGATVPYSQPNFALRAMAGGITFIVGMLAIVAVYLPVLRSVARFKAAFPDASCYLVQRGPGFRGALSKLAEIEPGSLKFYSILVATPERLQIWRPVPLECLADLPADAVRSVNITRDSQRARVALQVDAGHDEVVSLEMVPCSDRSGILAASPAELTETYLDLTSKLGRVS